MRSSNVTFVKLTDRVTVKFMCLIVLQQLCRLQNFLNQYISTSVYMPFLLNYSLHTQGN